MDRVLRVLVIDDSAYVRKVVREILSRSPFVEVVGAARDGREALDLVEELNPDVVTCDLMMPELDGCDASRLIRRLPGLELTPIIAVTAMEDAHELALQAGMSDYVRKPVDIRGLLNKVSGWLEPTAA